MAVGDTVRDRSLPWLGLSALLHGVAFMTLVHQGARPVHSVPDAIPVEFDVLSAVPAQAADLRGSTAGMAPDSKSPALPTRAAPKLPARARAPQPSAVPTPTNIEPSLRQGETPFVPGAEVVEKKPSPAWSTLDPRAAALSFFDPKAEKPVPSAAEKLNDAIARGAVRKNDRPPDPVLRQGPDGGYVFTGNGFTATISSTGDVDMTDQYVTVHIPLTPYQTPTGEWRFAILGGSFRLFEWLDRKFGKNDPYQSERRWFLERTRELRERLAREHAPRVPGQPP